ncbi:MAG: 4-alpha-glucanotransferase [Candidatus Omnitrophica bacterium]|nr:4-alpha-glucanotransferase [Candidatus Omnitrophota bacterium]
MLKRGSGLLLHISCLSSKFGIGDIGPKAFEFIDYLEKTKQSYWQILPLNPTDLISGNSPYSSASAFASNSLLISPEFMFNEGLIKEKDLEVFAGIAQDKVDYQAVTNAKSRIFAKAFERFKVIGLDDNFKNFCKDNAVWLNDFADFMVFKSHFEQKCWCEWPIEIRDRNQQAMQELRESKADGILKEKFLQFLFYKQWNNLKKYAKQKNVRIIGDIPIYVTYDSVDVWTNSEIFKLNQDKKLEFLAGVPPDYFSKTGQLWGNPVYDWDKLKELDYAWWMQRIEHNLKLFDLIRIDHFRGFVDFWQVPAGEETAINGCWVNAPARDFFSKLINKFPNLPILAEDLGIITDEVRNTMKDFSFAGMKILLFAFYEDLIKHPYLPHNYIENCVAYTGTHDNNTLRGWFEHELSSEDRKRLFEYLKVEVSVEDLNWVLIKLLMDSMANLVIIPVQDILNLGQEHRMNVPGIAHNNWQWRINCEYIGDNIDENLFELTVKSGR